MDDIRARLRLGDQLAREGQFAEAVDTYFSIGVEYAEAGFMLKAIAVFRQVVKIADDHAPGRARTRLDALKRLQLLYIQLGLSEDADAVSKLLGSEAV